MALSKTDIYNDVARLLKEARFSDITTDDVPLRYELDSVWDDGLAFVLEQGQWNFASRSATLSGTASTNRGYSYRFTKPTDFVRLISVSASASYWPPIENYDQDGSYFYANDATLYVTYVSNDSSYGTNVALFPRTYGKLLAAHLASEVGPHINKDPATIQRIDGYYEDALQLALAKDAINKTSRVVSTSTLAIYNAVLRLVGQRLTNNFDDKLLGRRVYDANGTPATKQSQGQPPSLPAYDVEKEALLRRLLDESYDRAVLYMLEQGLWNFAMRTVAMEEETDIEPAFGYSYVFERPADYVRLNAISDNGTMWPTLDDYTEEGEYWNANVAPLYMQYVSNGTSYGLNSSGWPETFKRALEAWLAIEIGPHAGVSARGMELLKDEFKIKLRDARSKDAFNQAAMSPPPGRLTRARVGYSSLRLQRREN